MTLNELIEQGSVILDHVYTTSKEGLDSTIEVYNVIDRLYLPECEAEEGFREKEMITKIEYLETMNNGQFERAIYVQTRTNLRDEEDYIAEDKDQELDIEGE